MLKAISGDKSGIILKENIVVISPEIRAKAKIKFETLKKQGIVMSDYDECKWTLTDEKNKYTISFDGDLEQLCECCNRAGVSYEKFIADLKVYVVLRFGTCLLGTLRTMVSFIIKETINSDYYTILCIKEDTYNIARIMYYTEFVKLIAPEKKQYIEKCETILVNMRFKNAELKRNEKHACSLNEFQSYFKFDEIIRDWWNDNDEPEGKYYYFPLYLFWIVTTILPLRVTEFCLLPYECIYQNGELYYLIIRRSRLKGSSAVLPKIHSYTIEGDYEKVSYEIPKWLYDEIAKYKNKSENYHRNYNLLFSLDYMYSHDKHKHKRKAEKETIFDAGFLKLLLKDFYVNVISEKYKMIIVSEEELIDRYKQEDGSYELYDDEIMMILPKHTRHLAMINLIMRGCNPIMIKEFAGHANEAISANYYGNISKTVRCVTKILYDKNKNRKERKRITNVSTINPLSLFINENDAYVEVDAGKCYSHNFLNSDGTDCRVCGGNCRNCRYLVPNIKDAVVPPEDEIDKEMVFIAKMLNDKEIDNKLTEYQIKLQTLQRGIANLATRIWQEEEENA